MPAMAHVLGAEDKLQDEVLSFHQDWTQVVKLDGKCLYPELSGRHFYLL